MVSRIAMLYLFCSVFSHSQFFITFLQFYILYLVSSCTSYIYSKCNSRKWVSGTKEFFFCVRDHTNEPCFCLIIVFKMPLMDSFTQCSSNVKVPSYTTIFTNFEINLILFRETHKWKAKIVFDGVNFIL